MAKDKTLQKRRLVGSLEETTKQVIRIPVFNPPEEEPPEEVSPKEKSPEGKIILERNTLYQHTENFDEKQNYC